MLEGGGNVAGSVLVYSHKADDTRVKNRDTDECAAVQKTNNAINNCG